MKKHLKEIYNEETHDGFVFMLDSKNTLEVSPFTYKVKSEPIEVHDVGYKYHIITYKETDEEGISNPDMFEAIIGNPHYYIENLIKMGFFGTICKKTKNSLEIVTEMFNSLLKHVYDETIDYEEIIIK